MDSMDYEIPSEITKNPFLAPLEAASEALTRLDERLRNNPLAEGWQARQHFVEAVAAIGLEGELVHIEELVLRDADMDVRLPTDELHRAMVVLRARRRVAGQRGGWALSAEGLKVLRGRAPSAGLPFYDANWNEDERLATWQGVLRQAASLPPLLASAVAMDAWAMLQPVQREPWLGLLLVSDDLRQRGRARNHLPAVALGLRQMRGRVLSGADGSSPTRRILGHLATLEAASKSGLRDLERLTLARELLHRRLEGRRTSSRLPEAVGMVLSLPLVSVPMIAKHLKISSQAANILVKDLSGSIREITDRKRYRAWGVL